MGTQYNGKHIMSTGGRHSLALRLHSSLQSVIPSSSPTSPCYALLDKNKNIAKKRGKSRLQMSMLDPETLSSSVSLMMNTGPLHLDHFVSTLTSSGFTIADAAAVAVEGQQKIICPGFGEPGWAPFCFLNGNPVFNAFDSFQALIQGGVVTLHDLLEKAGVEKAYGPAIILFTILVRILLFPLSYNQLASSQKSLALNPKIQEIKQKWPDNKELQNQMVALLYQETKVNPLAGCLPALAQTPVFIALYRSFLNLANEHKISEPFLWLPDLEGPVYGERSTDWLFNNWVNGAPPLGWENTAAFLSVPILLVIAQTVSLRILTPPSDDPAVQKSQAILKYLPLMIGYFSLSVPAGLGVYWVTNNILSTVTTASVKYYFKQNPTAAIDIDLDKLANSGNSAYTNPVWGYNSRQQMVDEAKLHIKPSRIQRIPAEFV
jgi:YidC/Oxa1 family membrane protein insertase